MRIITYNINGIRSAIKKGFFDWLKTNPADIVCVQEIKAVKENINASEIDDMGFYQYWFPAQKKGYSGVAVFSKIKPEDVHYGNGNEQSDSEGRVLQMDFQNYTLINTYFPSGSSGEQRQAYKYQWLNEFYKYLGDLKKRHHKLIVCGDYNICHRPIDIHDPVGNKNSSGFLSEERAWMDKFFESGFTDTFRYFHPEPDQYSWWSYRANARVNNKGWRIDYINATTNLKDMLKSAKILQTVKHSDHCPVFLELR